MPNAPRQPNFITVAPSIGERQVDQVEQLGELLRVHRLTRTARFVTNRASAFHRGAAAIEQDVDRDGWLFRDGYRAAERRLRQRVERADPALEQVAERDGAWRWSGGTHGR